METKGEEVMKGVDKNDMWIAREKNGKAEVGDGSYDEVLGR